MMSTHRMLPFHPPRARGDALPASDHPTPHLDPATVRLLREVFPARLTPAFEGLLRDLCTGTASNPGASDATDHARTRESLAVLRPCLTLAIDERGCRWIAETVTSSGIPGPVWCVYENPRVAVYIGADVREFLGTVLRQCEHRSMSGWLQSVKAAAERTWQRRGTLAFQSRQDCSADPRVRAWLLRLPRDARVYDLRSASFGDAWPYGAAGAAGRLHRCERELLFAVSGFPPPSRWADHLAHLALTEDMPVAAVIALARDRGAVAGTGQRSPDTLMSGYAAGGGIGHGRAVGDD